MSKFKNSKNRDSDYFFRETIFKNKNSRCPYFYFTFLLVVFLIAGFCFAEESFVYDSQGKPDPFTPWVTPDGRLQILKNQDEKTASEINVQGIVYDKNGLSYAIVNEQVVKISDEVDGYQVFKIEENKVLLIKDGLIKEIELKKEE